MHTVLTLTIIFPETGQGLGEMVSKREHKIKEHTRNVTNHFVTANIAVLIMMLSGKTRLHDVTVRVFQKTFMSPVFLDHLHFLMHGSL